MTNYVDLDELRDRVYFRAASLDDRFVWRQIFPVEDVENNLLRANPQLTPAQIEVLGKVGVIHGPNTPPRWADDFERFMIVDCAHREVDRDGDLCTHCGHAFEHSPHTVWETKGAKKAAAKRAQRKPRGTK